MSIALQDAPFDPGVLLAFFSRGRTETGAIVSFTGLARADGGKADILELEAYPGFTDSEIRRIAEEARHRFGLHDYMVLHRVGQIKPGEPIVFVATAAGHRREAFEAAEFLMDYLKSKAPFWKKQHGPDGETWIEPTDRDREDVARWEG